MHEDQDMRDELPSGAEMLGMEVASGAEVAICLSGSASAVGLWQI